MGGIQEEINSASEQHFREETERLQGELDRANEMVAELGAERDDLARSKKMGSFMLQGGMSPEQMSEENANLNNLITDLKSSLREQTEQSLDERDMLQQKISQLENANRVLDAEVQKFKQQILAIGHTGSQVSNLQEKVLELSGLKIASATMSTDNDGLRQDVERLTTENQELQLQTEELSATLDKLQEDIAQMQMRNNMLRQQIKTNDSQNEEITELNMELETIKMANVTLSADNTALKAQVSSSTASLTAAETLTKWFREQTSAIERQNTRLKRVNAEVMGDPKNFSGRAKMQLQMMTARATTLESTKKALQNNIQQLKSELDAVRNVDSTVAASNQKMREQVQALNNSNEQLINKVRGLKQRLNIICADDGGQLNDRIDQLLSENESLRGASTSLKQQVERLEQSTEKHAANSLLQQTNGSATANSR